MKRSNRKPGAGPAPTLVADIGGTNARFATAIPVGKCWSLTLPQTFSCDGAQGLADLLARYLASCGAAAPREGCIAIAGPVDGPSVSVTNLGWTENVDDLAAVCGLSRLRAMNDFAALAAGIETLSASESVELKPGDARKAAPMSVVGPGTGLGVALLLPRGGRWDCVATEGGHATFGPGNPEELALCAALQRVHQHVSAETLLSGRGLERIHEFLGGQSHRDAASISAAALAGWDAHARQAVQMFLDVLAGVDGDVALAHGATGGVWIGGGIIPRLLPLLDRSAFAARFTEKGLMRHYMERIPVRLVIAPDVALRGGAVANAAQRGQDRL